MTNFFDCINCKVYLMNEVIRRKTRISKKELRVNAKIIALLAISNFGAYVGLSFYLTIIM
uniref:DUF2116 family Zn-ribbon domain-containing protein n=1 Tax=Heterorhabditis bacteriophora TaxID=37862 RepID=A0A1I7WBI3_HETBA